MPTFIIIDFRRIKLVRLDSKLATKHFVIKVLDHKTIIIKAFTNKVTTFSSYSLLIKIVELEQVFA